MSTFRAGLVRTAVALVMVALVSNAPTANLQAPPTSLQSVAASAARAATGTVLGSALRGDNAPYPEARIRLRNVETGRGVARTTSDAGGRFRFESVDPSVYVVELLAQDDKVQAVGDVFAVTAGNQAVTVVRLSAKTRWVGGFFGNVAAAAIAAASTLGVTANGSSGSPASAQ